MHAKVISPVMFAAAAIGLAGCSGAQPAAPATVTQTVVRETVTVAPSSTEAATPEETVATSTAPSPVAAETFKMPSLVGKNLQLAQDTLQALGSYAMDQQDASGLERLQIDDSNWTVCSQTPTAGKKVPVATLVTLAAVKLSESCP